MSSDRSTDRRDIASPTEVFGQRAAYYVTSAVHTDPEVLARLVDLARPCHEDLVLDIGTGTGHMALALAPHVKTLIGMDLTQEMLAEAEALREQRSLDNVCWLLADAHRLPFASETFGVVACRRAAHHFADITTALAEMRRLVGPGGRLIIDDRTVPEDAGLDRLLNRLDELHDHSHVRQYPASEWARMLEQSGFVVDAVDVYTRHRPLTSLTEDVAAEDVAEIVGLVETMPADYADALHLEMREGQYYFDHYYMLLAARVPQSR